MIFSLQQLEEKSKNRPEGYKEDVLKLSKKIDNELYELEEKDYQYLVKKYSFPPRWQMIKNVIQAATDAAKNGFDTRSPAEIESIMKDHCVQCSYFREDGPRCGHCGCFLGGIKEDGGIKWGKALLKAWHCPIDKW